MNDPWFRAHTAIAAHLAAPRCQLAREVCRIMSYMPPTDPAVCSLRRAVLRDLGSAADHCGDPVERAAINRAAAALNLIEVKFLTVPLAAFPELVAACLSTPSAAEAL